MPYSFSFIFTNFFTSFFWIIHVNNLNLFCNCTVLTWHVNDNATSGLNWTHFADFNGPTPKLHVLINCLKKSGIICGGRQKFYFRTSIHSSVVVDMVWYTSASRLHSCDRCWWKLGQLLCNIPKCKDCWMERTYFSTTVLEVVETNIEFFSFQVDILFEIYGRVKWESENDWKWTEMIIPVVQDGLKALYGRIAGDHFVSTLVARFDRHRIRNGSEGIWHNNIFNKYRMVLTNEGVIVVTLSRQERDFSRLPRGNYPLF